MFPLLSRFLLLCCLWLAIGAVRALPVINEIHYDEDDPTVHSEYVELHNPAATPFDLSGCWFSDGFTLKFPAGTILEPGGFILLCEDPAVVQAKWGVSGNRVFSWNAGVNPPQFGQLRNSGEKITLRSAGGVVLDEVDYGRGFPWPTVGDPPNYSIELIHPSLDNDLGGSWRPSNGKGTGAAAIAYVPAGSSAWQYRKATSEPSNPGSAWRQTGFVMDPSWLTTPGGAPFGYGETQDTTLQDMQANPNADPPQTGYSGLYLRHSFDLTGPVPGALQLRVFNDDGFIAWINGAEVARFGPAAGVEVAWDAFAGRNHEHQTPDVISIPAPNALLNTGSPGAPAENVLTIHALNANASSSDFYLDADLSFPGSNQAASPTPLASNSVLSPASPPAVRQVAHAPLVAAPLPEWVPSSTPVLITARITDPDGVGAVNLSYQIVEPGNYISIKDPGYEAPASWITIPMSDDGKNGDITAGDQQFSGTIPATAQQHRRLIRYRIAAEDTSGTAVRAPYPEDPQPNFAYYVYDSLPEWKGRATPAAAEVTYPAPLLASVRPYHLITRTDQHSDAQNVPVPQPGGGVRNPTAGAYGHSLYNWHGALCHAGKVYDHIRFRARGGVWRFSMGKNMWKFDFNKGHDFEALDNYGRPYDQKWKKLNFSSCIQQGDFNYRGEQGLFESVGFRLFQLTGMPAENTQFVHFRIVERPSETNNSPSPFDDDFQGLYLAIEQQDGQFLDEHGLPDGNLYKMESGTGELNHTSATGPKNKSDLNAFLSYGTTEAWWRTQVDLPNYYNYRAIVDAIHHYDIGDGKNYFYYRNSLTSQWTVLPWDLDLTWADNMYRSDSGIAGLSPSGNSTEPFFSRVFGSSSSGAGPIPVLRMELRNRVREIHDLLFTPEQTGMLIDEMAAMIYQPGQPSFVDADRAMWDYNPILVSGFVNSSKAGHGRFYQSALNDPATPADETRSFAGMIARMKNYVNLRRNVVQNQVLTAGEEALLPATPALTLAGAAGVVPTNALSFTSSAFTGKNDTTFAGLQWRIAEVTDPASPNYQRFDRSAPRAYEIENAWVSPVLTAIPAVLTAPATAARPNAAYRARVKHLDSSGRWSHWSPPVSFVAGAPDISVYLQSLVISSLQYDPAPPTPAEAAVAPDAGAFEWIELLNVGTAPLDLTPVRFTKGIDFDFAGSQATVLLPGQKVLVVRNLPAFTARYGTLPAGTLIAGEWEAGDALSNSGEQIKLSFGAGIGIRDFVYDDQSPWPFAGDGQGYALVLKQPAALPDPADPLNWLLSTQPGGSPGQTTLAGGYAAWAAAYGNPDPLLDLDLDSYSNLTEYALGTSPASSADSPLVTASTATEAGMEYMEIRFRKSTAAPDVTVAPEATRNPAAWSEPDLAFTKLASVPGADNTVVETWRCPLSIHVLPQVFVRLRVTMNPAP